MGRTLIVGDALATLRELPDNTFDAMLTDPPYGIGFMGKEWDKPGAFVERKPVRANKWDTTGGNHNPSNAADAARTRAVQGRRHQEWVTAWATEALRVLKPGAFALVACGTRTQHRMAAGLEDAGFEVRDVIAWIYGQGFPKSHDVSKAIDKAAGAEREVVGIHVQSKQNRKPGNSLKGSEDASLAWQHDITAPATVEAARWQGYGTALKPAMELWTLVRKPPEGTVAANALTHGVGGLNIDGTRVGFASQADEAESKTKNAHADFGSGALTGYGGMSASRAAGGNYNPPGRWPANVIHDGSDEVLNLFPYSKDGVAVRRNVGHSSKANIRFSHGSRDAEMRDDVGYGGSGSAARFFMECKGYNETWPHSPTDPANTAGSTSSPPNEFAASAPNDAATSANPEGNSKPHYPALSTNVTANASNANAANDTQPTPSTAPRFSREPEPTSAPGRDRANDAEPRTPTGTTTTTANPSTCGTSAARATSSTTFASEAPGGLASAARFKYTAKASRREREAGTTGNAHPTVKPLALTEYLARLLLPPAGDEPRRIIVPFSGVGSEVIGALQAGWDEAVGIEIDPEYVRIAEARIAHWIDKPVTVPDTPLFPGGDDA